MSALVRRAAPWLRAALGAWLLSASLALALLSSAARAFAPYGPSWARLALAWSEAIAAALFLVPSTAALGGRLLLFVLGGAAGLHAARGERPIAVLAYAVLVLALPAPAPPHPSPRP